MQLAFIDQGQRETIMKYPAKLAYTVISQALVGIPIGLFLDSYLGVTGGEASLQTALITFGAIYGFQVLLKAVTGKNLNKLLDVMIYYA
jgi:F0F1-type ATP synthase assembly protein I